MKLQKSKLCVNCESLFEQPSACPYCGSEIFVWLSRALGTTIEEDMAEMPGCGGPAKGNPGTQTLVFRSGSPAAAYGGKFMESRPFAEFRHSCGRVGREMMRVLTLGLGQACK